MNVQAEVSLYPLRKHEIGTTIARFLDFLRRSGLDLEVGPMSSLISGEPWEVFDAIRDAFVQLANEHQVVLVLKASNACPENVTLEQNKEQISTVGGNPDG